MTLLIPAIPQVPAVIVGIALGPVGSKFLDAERWGFGAEDQQHAITLVCSNIASPETVNTDAL